MITIEQILVINDPWQSSRETVELTFDEVAEYGETYFAPKFTAHVFMTNGSSYSFVKAADGIWTSMEFLEDDEYREIQEYAGTFHDALNKLLEIVNLKFSQS